MCAASSLFAMNCLPMTADERKLLAKSSSDTSDSSEDEARRLVALDKRIVRSGRLAMVVITLAGLAVAFAVLYIPGFGLKYLWWIFNTVAACVAVPTILSLYWSKLSSTGVFWGIVVSFVLGVPLFIYSNVNELTWLSIASSVGIIAVSTIFCLAFPRRIPFDLENTSPGA